MDNNGVILPEERDSGILHATPRFMTDSPALGDYLSQDRFESEVRSGENGLETWIFDEQASA